MASWFTELTNKAKVLADNVTAITGTLNHHSYHIIIITIVSQTIRISDQSSEHCSTGDSQRAEPSEGGADSQEQSDVQRHATTSMGD